MDFIFVIVFIIFFVLPWFNKAKKKGKKSNRPAPSRNNKWGQTHEQIKANKYGHSGASNTAHKRLHSKDTSSAFPKGHRANVRKRDLRDQIEKRKMERTIHSSKNTGIIRASNKGRDDWGARGDKTSLGGLFALLIIGAVLVMIASEVLPKYF